MARKEIIEASLLILKAGFIIGTWGNMSTRIIGDELVAITPTGVEYDKLIPENIPIVDMEGNLIDGNMKPSIDLRLHLEIYKNRPDINAIIHTHSIHCTAMAVARKPIPAACEDLVQIVGGDVRVSPYRLPNADDFSAVILTGLENRQAVIMANHGLLSAGGHLKEAVKIAFVCEKAAHVTILAEGLGGAISLDDSDCFYMRDFYLNKYGQK